MDRLEPELKQIVKRSTTQIADHAYQRGENLAQESQPRCWKADTHTQHLNMITGSFVGEKSLKKKEDKKIHKIGG